VTPPDRPLQPIRGERVYLRAIEPDDAGLIHEWYQDAETAGLMGELPRSLARRRQRIEEAGDGDDFFSFVICLLVDDRPIGRLDLFAIDRRNGSAAFGLAIGDRALWGRGYGTDAVNAVVDFAFGQLRLERVWLDTDAANVRAHRVYEKAGFTVEGRFRRAFYQDGQFLDDIRMAMLRDEWQQLSRPKSWDLVRAAARAGGREILTAADAPSAAS
jgi:RimJ/RimL family protein N-acetyltransferase